MMMEKNLPKWEVLKTALMNETHGYTKMGVVCQNIESLRSTIWILLMVVAEVMGLALGCIDADCVIVDRRCFD